MTAVEHHAADAEDHDRDGGERDDDDGVDHALDDDGAQYRRGAENLALGQRVTPDQLANKSAGADLAGWSGAHALGEGRVLSPRTVLGTVVVERVVDTVIVVALAAISVVVLGVGGAISTAVVLGAAFVSSRGRSDRRDRQPPAPGR